MSQGVRLDHLGVFLLEQACTTLVGGRELWNNGGREIAEAAVKHAGVPTKNVTPLDIAYELGMFPKPKDFEIEKPNPRPHRTKSGIPRKGRRCT